MVQTTAAYRRTHSPSQVAWSEGRRPLGAVLHSSNEPSELSQLPCGHGDSTINSVMGIIIIIIKKMRSRRVANTYRTVLLKGETRLAQILVRTYIRSYHLTPTANKIDRQGNPSWRGAGFRVSHAPNYRGRGSSLPSYFGTPTYTPILSS